MSERVGEESSEELLAQVRAAYTDDTHTDALTRFHRRGGQTEFDLAAGYCGSSDSDDKAVGALALGQLGLDVEGGTYVSDSVKLLLALLADPDDEVVECAAIALGRRDVDRAAPALIELADRPNPQVRLGVIHGISTLDHPLVVPTLVQLAGDPDRDVRNWALFSLGSLRDERSEDLINALVTGTEDPDHEIRGEAIVGLARRTHPTAFGLICKEWERDHISMLSIRAAQHLADARLIEPLLELQRTLGPGDDIAAAIEQCQRSITPELSSDRLILDGGRPL